MPLRDKSVTLMRFYGFPHHGHRFFAGAQNDAFRSPSLWRFPFSITSDVLSPNRHSERWQECLVGKTGNGTVTRSEESVTLDDVLPASSPRVQILHIRSGWRFMVFFITAASLRHRSGWYLTVRRQKKLLAHAVRLRILACRNDLNRKRTISL